MIKRWCAMLLVLALCLALAACGLPVTVERTETGYSVKTEEEETPAPTEEPETAQTPEPTPETTPEPTPEPTEEPTEEPLTFAEEHGWRFEQPHEVTIPVTQNATADYLEFHPLSVTLSAPQISCSEADEEGYVTYTVVYNAPSGLDLYFEGEAVDDLFANTRDYDLFDLYTGAKIPAKLHLELGEGQRYDDSAFGSVIEYNGTEYEVFYGAEMTADEPTQDVIEDGAGFRLLYSVNTTMTYTIRAPQEYDGLALGLDFVSPAAAYADDGEEMEVTFWEEDNDPAGWTFVRLSDCCG